MSISNPSLSGLSPLPYFLRPLAWCGSRWRQLGQCDPGNRVSQLIAKIALKALLTLATGLAVVVGMVHKVRQLLPQASRNSSATQIFAVPVTADLQNRMGALGISGRSDKEIASAISENLTRSNIIGVFVYSMNHRFSEDGLGLNKATPAIGIRSDISHGCRFFDDFGAAFHSIQYKQEDVVDYILGCSKSSKARAEAGWNIRRFEQITLVVSKDLNKMEIHLKRVS